MRMVIFGLAALIAMGTASRVPANDKLAELKLQYTELKADIATEQKRFHARYEEELAKLETQAQSDGDLKLVIAVREEKKAYSTRTGESPKSPHASLARLQAIFDQQTALIKKGQTVKLMELNQGYRKQLEELRGNLTKEGKIDAALLVQQEIDNLGSELVLPTPTELAGKPSSPPTTFSKPPNQIRTPSDLAGHAAALEVDKMKVSVLSDLKTKDDNPMWKSIPESLAGQNALMIFPTEGTGGVAKYKVTKSGFALLACNYSYQGNSGGGWQDTRWTKEKFEDEGWKVFDEKDMGGKLIKADDREQIIFYKKLEAGEEGELRCNKYDPPYFILIGQ